MMELHPGQNTGSILASDGRRTCKEAATHGYKHEETDMKKWMTKDGIEGDWHLMDAPDKELSPISIEYQVFRPISVATHVSR
ncbi:hypothetical protein E4U38_008454 [Claviceps purpurea]|nr:hypothetical protein E4U38_008454 [Claviceps purpurea]KAG6151326.1 hypothetical protein E4U51_000760 [Claviceps purpurea]